MSYDELFNKTVYETSPEELATIYDEADKALMASRGNQQYEADVKYSDGSIKSVEFRKTVHISESGEVKGILGLMNDITQRKQDEARKQLTNKMKETMLHLNNKITTYENKDDFFNDVLFDLQELFGKSQQSSILEIDDEGIARVIASYGYDKKIIEKFRIKKENTFLYRKSDKNFDGSCINNNIDRTSYTVDPQQGISNEAKYIQSSLEIPVEIDGSAKYIFSINSLQNNIFDENDLIVGDYIRTQFQILYRVFNLYQRTLKLSRYDVMTGLMNRHYFDQNLIKAISIAKENKSTFYIVLYDLDGLKKVNDLYGHELGDHYISKFSSYLKKYFVSENITGRIGGDEFMGIIYGMDREAIVNKIENIRDEFMKEKFFTSDGHIGGAFSYGLEEYDESIHSLKQLVKAADEEMYKYKRRFRVNPK